MIKNFFKNYKRKINYILKDYLNIEYYYNPSIEQTLNHKHNANIITLFYTENKCNKYEKMLSYYEGLLSSLDNTYNINKDEIIKYKNSMYK